ncbi:hypothetical protein [Ascidiimonas sp. W6]|uniref:hypothetical protein n=1 Tax=Ascidiimonas meishanensis TaxID=3128903 RepID=UPI0030ED48D1
METYYFLIKSLLTIFLVTLVSVTYAQQNDSCKCCTSAHQQFDFWKGKWKTYTPDGKLAGTNQIEKIQDNCILREDWKSASGSYSGTSYNYYNQTTKQWEQIWIDNQGQNLHLKGGFQTGRMILISDSLTQSDGGYLINRITWTPLKQGWVRQHWETKKDKGEWVTVFDGTYKPVEEE